MSAWIIQSLLRLRASYYFLPALMCLGAILLAIVTTLIDLRYQAEVRDILGWFFASTVDSARSVLTTIAGSMISVAAVTFSLTMVAVTTAAGQYGPRLIGNFMRDRANQITLGMFLATFLYCMVVLKSVSEEITINAHNTVGVSPSLSVLVALVLTLISVCVLIFFVHHIPETLNVGNITGNVSKGLIGQIEQGRFPIAENVETINDANLEDPFDPNLTQVIHCETSGYIQAVSLKGMRDWAQDNHCQLRLLSVPGDFTMQGDPLVEITPDKTSETLDQDRFRQEKATDVLSFVAIGQERTAHQNILFLADELVEIAARALSPGINDPFTAINCIHWYSDICLSMINSDTALNCVVDRQGKPRIWANSVGFETVCEKLFGQSRQYVCEDENTAREALKVLYRLKKRASDLNENAIDDQITRYQKAIEQSKLGESQKARLNGEP